MTRYCHQAFNGGAMVLLRVCKDPIRVASLYLFLMQLQTGQERLKQHWGQGQYTYASLLMMSRLVSTCFPFFSPDRLLFVGQPKLAGMWTTEEYWGDPSSVSSLVTQTCGCPSDRQASPVVGHQSRCWPGRDIVGAVHARPPGRLQISRRMTKGRMLQRG